MEKTKVNAKLLEEIENEVIYKKKPDCREAWLAEGL